jgi:zinc transport system permease protein
VACGVIGSFVVVKRIGYLAGGVAHAALGGMGVAYFLGQGPLIGALVAALISAVIIALVSLRLKEREDTLIGAIWAIGMAIGIIFISKTPGYNVDLLSYLFGNILMIPKSDLYLMVSLDAVILVIVYLFYRRLVAICFDEEFARLRGVNVDGYYILLLTLVAMTVTLLIQVVGLVMVIALLTLPSAIAGHFTKTIRAMMIVSVALGALFTFVGLAISYSPDLPTGATIILIAGISYLASTLVHGVLVKGAN